MPSFDLTLFPGNEAAYLVGGSVRDFLLNRGPFADIDIAVGGQARSYARRLAAKIGGRLVEMGRGTKVVYRVVGNGRIFDISPLKGSVIEDDLARRDFSVNAMALSLRSKRIVDPHGGRNDLQRRCIRMLSPAVFRSDPLRMLRAYRLGAVLGFCIERETGDAIRKAALWIRESAGERIRTELFHLFQSAESWAYLTQMIESGLLFALFSQSGRRSRFRRSETGQQALAAYRMLEKALHRSFPASTPVEELIDRIDDGQRILLKFAVLLHDIGGTAPPRAGSTAAASACGRGAGREALLTQDISNRLRLSNRDRSFLNAVACARVKALRLFDDQAKTGYRPQPLLEFLMACGDLVPPLLLLAKSDMESRPRLDARTRAAFDQFVQKTAETFLTRYLPHRSAPPILTGHDLIHDFGLTPSPLFGVILGKLDELRLAGSIGDKAAACRWVRRFLNKQGAPS